ACVGHEQAHIHRRRDGVLRQAAGQAPVVAGGVEGAAGAQGKRRGAEQEGILRHGWSPGEPPGGGGLRIRAHPRPGAQSLCSSPRRGTASASASSEKRWPGRTKVKPFCSARLRKASRLLALRRVSWIRTMSPFCSWSTKFFMAAAGTVTAWFSVPRRNWNRLSKLAFQRITDMPSLAATWIDSGGKSPNGARKYSGWTSTALRIAALHWVISRCMRCGSCCCNLPSSRWL